jgi:hypothetical protein
VAVAAPSPFLFSTMIVFQTRLIGDRYRVRQLRATRETETSFEVAGRSPALWPSKINTYRSRSEAEAAADAKNRERE